MYDAAINPKAYGRFVEELYLYLEDVAVNAWQIESLADVDIERVEADRGLALHFQRMNELLARSDRSPKPTGLRQRTADSPRVALLFDREGAIVAHSRQARLRFGTDILRPADIVDHLHADDGKAFLATVETHRRGGTVTGLVMRGADCHLIARSLHSEADAKDYLLVEILDVAWSDALEAALRASFGLSLAETRVVEQLSTGASVAEIAARSGRSQGTIRNQTKSVLAKTGAGTVANLNRIVALMSESVADRSRPPRPDLDGEIDIFALPDGRTLEVRLQGPEDGRPVVFFHGQLFGTEMSRQALDLLHTHGLRLVAPSRPNFSISDPPPGPPENEPFRLAQDIVAVLDRYGAMRATLLTNISSTHYGYAVAAALSERFAGLVHAGCVLPVLTARQYAAMPPTQRVLYVLMRFAPDFLPPLYRAGLSQIHSAGELEFLLTLYREGTPDHAVIVRPDLRDLLVRSVRFNRSWFGVFTDMMYCVRDWSDLAQATVAAGVPVTHVHGTEDPTIMIEDARRFCDRFDGIDLVAVDGAGQLVLFDRPEVVFGEVARLAHRHR